MSHEAKNKTMNKKQIKAIRSEEIYLNCSEQGYTTWDDLLDAYFIMVNHEIERSKGIK